jgi:GntR family transcriptional repressor for pyruvate dehydrogenase complex
MIQKIKRASAVDLVFEEMKAAILDNHWKVGEKIPSENELSQIYGVNRLTVRMALQKLNTIGLTKTKVGEGSFVQQFEFSRYIDQTAGFDVSDEMLNAVCDFRKLLELECARLAMEAASEEEKEELHHLLRIMLDIRQKKLEGDDSEYYLVDFTTADLNFHHFICTMSHNILYVRAFEMARPSIEKYIRIGVAKAADSQPIEQPVDVDGSKDIHVSIYQSIISGDFEYCKAVYTEMLRSLYFI